MSAVEQTLKPVRVTPQEYLERERAAEKKSEYWDGEIVAMAGASLSHNRISRNLGVAFSIRLGQSPCEPFTSDMKVRVSRNKYFYPDAVVACAPLEMDDEHQDILLNPSVIVKVLSPSTQAKDKDEKFGWYQQIQTVIDYITVSQDEMHAQHYARQANGQWLLTNLRGPEALLRLPSIGCELPLSEIYARVTFPPAEEEI